IYSGIDGIHLQDQAITESMGPITDHAFEHLAPSDQMITRTRRRLLLAARALRDKNILPPGVEDAEVFRGAGSGYFVSDDKAAWRDVQYEAFTLRYPIVDRNPGRLFVQLPSRFARHLWPWLIRHDDCPSLDQMRSARLSSK